MDAGTVTLAAGKTFEKAYEVESPGVFLFEFNTAAYDVQFSALWLPHDGQPEVVFPLQKVHSHKGLVRGSHACASVGKMTLRWSNEFSILRSKTISYDVSFADTQLTGSADDSSVPAEAKEEAEARGVESDAAQRTYVNRAWSHAKARFGELAGATLGRPVQVVGSIQESVFPAIDRAWGVSKSLAFATVQGITRFVTQLPGNARDTREAIDGSLQIAKATLDVVRSEESSECTAKWMATAEAAGHVANSPEARNVLMSVLQVIQSLTALLASPSFRRMLATLPASIAATYKFFFSAPVAGLTNIVLSVADHTIDVAQRTLRIQPRDGSATPFAFSSDSVSLRSAALTNIDAMVKTGVLTPEEGLDAISGVLKNEGMWKELPVGDPVAFEKAVLQALRQ